MMIKINCAVLQHRAILTEISIEIAADARIADLHEAITTAAKTNSELTIYLGKRTTRAKSSTAWMMRDKLCLLDEQIVRRGLLAMRDPTHRLDREEYCFGKDFAWRKDDIHIVPLMERDSTGEDSEVKEHTPTYRFSGSLQRELMAYSRGSPGIFGSLVEFTIVSSKWTLPGDAWRHWFESTAFPQYVQRHLKHFGHFVDEWHALTGLDWTYLVDKLGGPSSTHARTQPTSSAAKIATDTAERLRVATADDHDTRETDGFERISRRMRLVSSRRR